MEAAEVEFFIVPGPGRVAAQVSEQERNQAGFLMHGRQAGPDPASIGHRLPGNPRHRHRRLETSPDPLASGQRDRAELQLSLFGHARCDQRLVPSGSHRPVPKFYHAAVGCPRPPAPSRPGQAAAGPAFCIRRTARFGH